MTATTAKLLLLLACLPVAALAKLPTPELSPEEQAKAAETKAKAAHQAKVAAYQTCLASDKAVAHYFRTHPQASKPTAAPACVNPGPFVAAASAGAPQAAAPTAAAAPAANAIGKKP